ncbi:hypothetical protein BS50DRAFT_681009 [Corynespora cassiicola Philippines]|uniref:Uncharacterized protein n=1 Tax=Corynespora cassiicola Philippines TaxID=1448308 RepID=A0A2T2N6X6_CORCC|nr:hypothetical protein BS50DRAFT_681009 [Corynespora cassiicola Philippines]
MLSNLLVVVASLAAASCALKIPRGVTDGTYVAYINSTGHEVHELVSSPSRTVEARYLNPYSPKWYLEPAPTGLARKYPYSVSWCGCGFNVDETNTADATADLYKQIDEDDDTKLMPGESYYSVRGSVVAFVCNYIPAEGHKRYPKSDLVSDGAHMVDQNCGKNIAGTWDTTSGSGLFFGRMRMSEGLDFCKDATGSSSSTCEGTPGHEEANKETPGFMCRTFGWFC